jgi:hypothetical protein
MINSQRLRPTHNRLLAVTNIHGGLVVGVYT